MLIDSEEIKKRFSHHSPTATKLRCFHDVRSTAMTFAKVVESSMPECREKSIAIKKIEEAMFWANAGIARRDDHKRCLKESGEQ